MTIEQVIKLITDEQHSLNKRKQTALARGLWIKAAECEHKTEALQGLKKVIAAEVQRIEDGTKLTEAA
jgi:hypothetical protein